MSATDDLTPKQRKFVETYLAGWNATRAAKEAGYSHPGQAGHRLLQDPRIRAAVDARLAEAAMSADEVLARLTQQARVSLADFITIRGKRWDFDLKKAEEAGVLHLIQEIAETEHGTRLKLVDSQAALQMLGKHHRLFVDRQEHSGPDGGAIPLALQGIVTLDDDELRRRLEAAREHLAAGGIPDQS